MLRVETRQEIAPVFVEWFKHLHGTDFSHNLQKNDVRAFALTDLTPGNGEQQDKVSILSVAILHNWSEYAVEVSVGSNGEKRQKNSKDMMFAVFNYVFNVAKRICMYAHIAVDNTKSIALAEKIGFRKVGAVSDYYGEDKDAWLYTYTKRNWLDAINKGQTQEVIH